MPNRPRCSCCSLHLRCLEAGVCNWDFSETTDPHVYQCTYTKSCQPTHTHSVLRPGHAYCQANHTNCCQNCLPCVVMTCAWWARKEHSCHYKLNCLQALRLHTEQHELTVCPTSCYSLLPKPCTTQDLQHTFVSSDTCSHIRTPYAITNSALHSQKRQHVQYTSADPRTSLQYTMFYHSCLARRIQHASTVCSRSQ